MKCVVKLNILLQNIRGCAILNSKDGERMVQRFLTKQLIINGQAFGMRRGVCLANAGFRPHTHECLEVVYTLSGAGTHYVDERAYAVQHGDMVFVPSGAVHQYTATEQMTYINFYIDPTALGFPHGVTVCQMLRGLYPELLAHDGEWERYRLPDSASVREVDFLAETVHREYHSKKPGYVAAVDGYMRVLLTKIMRLMIPRADSGRGKGISLQLMDYVEKNYTQRLTLTDLAELFYYNPVYLGKLFRNAFNMSFKEYLCQKRLNHAERLLLESNQNIDAVALSSGFSDKKYFYRVFHQRHQCTPLEFRRHGNAL